MSRTPDEQIEYPVADGEGIDAFDPAAGVTWIRSAEAHVLLRAIRALRLDGILSEAEYQAKRQRLAAQL